MMRLLIAGILLSILTGCANFKNFSDFANSTQDFSKVVRAEIDQIDDLCRKEGEVRIVLTISLNEEPLKQCDLDKATIGKFLHATTDIMDTYAKVLLAFADDRQFDVSTKIEDTSKKVNNLKSAEGGAIVDSKAIAAMTNVTSAMANAWSERERENGIKKLIEQIPNLKVVAETLRRYFYEPDRKAPYLQSVELTALMAETNRKVLWAYGMDEQGIRARELYREAMKRVPLFEKRLTNETNSVPQQMASTIDAWIQSLEELKEHAFTRNPKELYGRLNGLGKKVLDAGKAIQQASED